MRFSPLTEKQAIEAKFKLLEKGLGNFEITKAEEKYNDRQQCDMLYIVLKCRDYHGKQGLIHEYLLSNQKFGWRIRELCECVGLMDEYEKGELTPQQLVGKTGPCDIGISKDKDGKYPDKNNIREFKKSEAVSAPKPVDARAEIDDLDDDIPF